MKEPPGPSTRAESVTPEKPIFRDAFRRNRCRLLISVGRSVGRQVALSTSRARMVSRRVNFSRAPGDHATLIEPVAPAGPEAD
jgi:hypothetical protein